MFAQGARGCPSLGSGGGTAHSSPPEVLSGDFLWENCSGKGAEGGNPQAGSLRKGLGSAQGLPRARHSVVSGGCPGLPAGGEQSPRDPSPRAATPSQGGCISHSLGWLSQSPQTKCLRLPNNPDAFPAPGMQGGHSEDTHRALLVPPLPSTQPWESFCFPESLLA